MKTAMITGGSRGIGLAISRQLQLDGFTLSILGTTPSERVADVMRDLASGGPVLYTRGNLADTADRQAFVEATLQAFGRIDLLVNNAGVAPLERADLLEMNEESYDRVMAINLKGPVFLSQLVVRQMLRQPEKGMVINIGSISSDTASINRAEYCLSKAGVTMFTRLLAVRLAGEAIPVYEVSPGIIETDMTATVHSKYDALIGQGLLPIPRWGQPEDVAAAVALLASGRLGYSTGECLHVDGGFHLRRL